MILGVDFHPVYTVEVISYLDLILFYGLLNYGFVVTTEMDFRLTGGVCQVKAKHGFRNDAIHFHLIHKQMHGLCVALRNVIRLGTQPQKPI